MTTVTSTTSAPAGIAALPTLPILGHPENSGAATEPSISYDAADAVGTEFRAIGTTVRLLTTDPRALVPATDLLRHHLEAHVAPKRDGRAHDGRVDAV